MAELDTLPKSKFVSLYIGPFAYDLRILNNIHLVIPRISKLTFKPSRMMAGNGWLFIAVAVLAATAVSSKQVSGVGMFKAFKQRKITK